jgi:hypothetical protein
MVSTVRSGNLKNKASKRVFHDRENILLLLLLTLALSSEYRKIYKLLQVISKIISVIARRVLAPTIAKHPVRKQSLIQFSGKFHVRLLRAVALAMTER